MSLLGRAGNRRAVHTAERVWARAATALLDLEINITGMHHVDTTKQYVVVSLHEGLTDPVALLRLPLGLRFAARDELFDWPALGRYLRASDQVRVDEQPGRASLRRLYREIGAAFEVGDSLVMFPQGSVLGVEVAFQPGAFRIARHFDRPVLPVVLAGSHRVWEHPFSSTVRLGQRVTMRVLPPIAARDLDAAAILRLERTMKHVALDSQAPVRRFVPERDGWWDDYRYEIDPCFIELADRLTRRRAGRLAVVGRERTRPAGSIGDDLDTPPEGDVATDVPGSV
jgi:1-acyl-sn-glycerol-3-phosphate acyltransferase